VVIGDIDAGEDDFLRASVDLAGDGVADCFEWQRNARPTCLPDGAKGAAVVAAGLDPDEALDVTPGMLANVAGSSSAAQPVTRIFEVGRWRCARRIACRVWRTASLVTAQLLTTIQSSSAGAERAIVSVSAKFSRQPSVTVSTLNSARPARAHH
jgi:hypothetical protein